MCLPFRRKRPKVLEDKGKDKILNKKVNNNVEKGDQKLDRTIKSKKCRRKKVIGSRYGKKIDYFCKKQLFYNIKAIIGMFSLSFHFSLTFNVV